MKTELERYREALQAITCIGGGAIAAEKAWEIAKDALNPAPVYETVKLERWECACCGNIVKGECPAYKCVHGGEWVYLTGTVQREKKMPVERSVTIHDVIWKQLSGTTIIFPSNGTRAVDWGQFLNKKGPLTFVYTEDPTT